MTDIQHNISDDHIIKNTTDIGNDYKFANHNVDPSRDQPAGMVLFRLLTPGPSNLRGRTEAYQVSISTGLSTGPASNVTNVPPPLVPPPAFMPPFGVAIAAIQDFAHIEGPAGGTVGAQPTEPMKQPGEVDMGAAAAGPMAPGSDAPDFGGGGGGMGPGGY